MFDPFRPTVKTWTFDYSSRCTYKWSEAVSLIILRSNWFMSQYSMGSVTSKEIGRESTRGGMSSRTAGSLNNVLRNAKSGLWEETVAEKLKPAHSYLSCTSLGMSNES